MMLYTLNTSKEEDEGKEEDNFLSSCGMKTKIWFPSDRLGGTLLYSCSYRYQSHCKLVPRYTGRASPESGSWLNDSRSNEAKPLAADSLWS